MTDAGAAGPTGRRFLSSTLAAYGSQLGRMAIRLVAELALARLVLPEGYGLFYLGYIVVTIAGACRDLGLPYQLVRDERQPYGTVLVWELAAGGVITAALALGAPLFARLDPGLPRVLTVFSLWVFLDALSVVPKVFFERRLAVGRLVAPEIWRGATFAVVAISLAAGGHGVWSLVFGELAAAALHALLLWVRAWPVMPRAPRLELLPGLVSGSFLLFLVWLAALATGKVDSFIVGSFADAATVGQYNKAYQWGLMLQALLMPAIARVLYPALVEYRGERDRFVGAYRVGTVSILACEALAAYFLFFNADVVLLKILAGEHWGPAVPLLKILCFVPLLDPFARFGGELLKVEREDRTWLLAVFTNFASLLLFGILFTRRWGVAGMAWANYLPLGSLLITWRVWRLCGREVWRLVRELAYVYLLPLPLFAAVAWLFPPASWARFAASLVAAAAVGLLLLRRFAPPFRAFFTAEEAPAPEAAP